MNIAQVLRDQARLRGANPAIVDGAEAIGFEALDRATAQAAAALDAAGLRAGDRALLFCPMSVRLYVTLVGMFRAGVTPVFVDPSAGRAHLMRCCERARPRGFVAIPRAHGLRLVSGTIRRLPVKLAIGGGLPGTRSIAGRAKGAPLEAITPREEGDAALMTFTSGSTGEPKAAVRTHGFLLAQHRVLAEELALRAGEIDLATLPIFVLANLASGVTSVIPDLELRAPGTVDAGRLAARIRMERPTRTAASPALLDRLARHLEATGERLDGMTSIFTGGAPVFPRVLDRLAAVAPNASVTAVYGSTEAEPIAHLERREISEGDREAMRGGAGLLAGRPVRSIDARILPDRWGSPLGPFEPAAFEAAAVTPGEPGEIVVAGAHVLSGYLDGVGDADAKIRVGTRVWHRTGDAGYFDERGRLWLLGRCRARVADERGALYPFAVECAASDADGVRRTAFVLHRRKRTLVVELERSAPGTVPQLLRDALRWARIDDVVVVGAIPVDQRHHAKIDYPALQAMLG